MTKAARSHSRSPLTDNRAKPIVRPVKIPVHWPVDAIRIVRILCRPRAAARDVRHQPDGFCYSAARRIGMAVGANPERWTL